MIQTPLYPLSFQPIYQYRLWGGLGLADLLRARFAAIAMYVLSDDLAWVPRFR